MSGELLTYLPWDSTHFGKRIARATPRQLDSNLCNELLRACQDQAIDCLYFLANAADQATISTVLASRFDFVDIRLTLSGQAVERPPSQRPSKTSFRLGQAADFDALQPIAGTSFRQSRFYVDGRFGGQKVAQMYQTWLHKSLTTEFANMVVVAELDGRPVGFVTCHLDSQAGEGKIGLVGVAETARGIGCGYGMIHFAMRRLHEQGLEKLSVVTQGRNIAAQNLYQRCGFVTGSVDLWFHKWFTSPNQISTMPDSSQRLP